MGIHMGGGSAVEANSAPRWGQMVADVRIWRKIPTMAHFAKPLEYHGENRAESPKTIQKTARRTVKTPNKGPKFR